MNYTDGDVLLLSTVDAGNITFENGLLVMTGGFSTAIYLSLFGGNKDDNGTESTKKNEWWGNILDTDNPDRKMISRTQNIITGLPATPENLNLIDQAIRLDLAWMLELQIIDELIIDLSIPQKNRIEINIIGKKIYEEIFNIQFEQNWIAESMNK